MKEQEEEIKEAGGEELLEASAQEQNKTPTKREELNRILAEEIPDYNSDDEEASAEMLIGYINGSREQKNKLAEALQQDPRLAQMLADIVSKKRGAGSAMVRYFGRDLINAEEGTPEYDEIQAAEEERKSEMEAMEAGSQEYSSNLEASMPIVEEWCKEKGYQMDEFLDKVWETVISPIMSGNYSREVCELLDKGMNYDKDTADALAAGVVKGRNENINKLREEQGDGMPKGITSTAPEKTTKARNPMLEAALQA